MSTANFNHEYQPDPADDNVHGLSDGEADASSAQNKRFLLAIAALVGAIALIFAIIFIPWGGSDGSNESAPEEIQDGYVDDSGQQEQTLTPVPLSYEGIEEIALTMDAGSAPVDMVGLSDGELIPPEDVTRLAWYANSAVPGSQGNVGSTVITGHVNHQSQGQGFAYNFTQLKEGDEVNVLIDGKENIYRVTKPPFRVAKGSGMPAEVNDTDGPNKLVLITCGGEFVGGELGYADNVFVVAEPK